MKVRKDSYLCGPLALSMTADKELTLLDFSHLSCSQALSIFATSQSPPALEALPHLYEGAMSDSAQHIPSWLLKPSLSAPQAHLVALGLTASYVGGMYLARPGSSRGPTRPGKESSTKKDVAVKERYSETRRSRYTRRTRGQEQVEIRSRQFTGDAAAGSVDSPATDAVASTSENVQIDLVDLDPINSAGSVPGSHEETGEDHGSAARSSRFGADGSPELHESRHTAPSPGQEERTDNSDDDDDMNAGIGEDDVDSSSSSLPPGFPAPGDRDHPLTIRSRVRAVMVSTGLGMLGMGVLVGRGSEGAWWGGAVSSC